MCFHFFDMASPRRRKTDKQVHLLRDGRVAEGSSGARLDRVELWGVTEGGNRDNGAEGATLVLLPKDGDSGFGVEELDVARSTREEKSFIWCWCRKI